MSIPNIPTLEELGRRLELKRQNKDWRTHISDKETNALYTLNQLSELEEVKETSKKINFEMTEAQNRILKILTERGKKTD